MVGRGPGGPTQKFCKKNRPLLTFWNLNAREGGCTSILLYPLAPCDHDWDQVFLMIFIEFPVLCFVGRVKHITRTTEQWHCCLATSYPLQYGSGSSFHNFTKPSPNRTASNDKRCSYTKIYMYMYIACNVHVQ